MGEQYLIAVNWKYVLNWADLLWLWRIIRGYAMLLQLMCLEEIPIAQFLVAYIAENSSGISWLLPFPRESIPVLIANWIGHALWLKNQKITMKNSESNLLMANLIEGSSGVQFIWYIYSWQEFIFLMVIKHYWLTGFKIIGPRPHMMSNCSSWGLKFLIKGLEIPWLKIFFRQWFLRMKNPHPLVETTRKFVQSGQTLATKGHAYSLEKKGHTQTWEYSFSSMQNPNRTKLVSLDRGEARQMVLCWPLVWIIWEFTRNNNWLDD